MSEAGQCFSEVLDLGSCSYASGEQAGQALDQREMAQGIAFKCAEGLLCFTDVTEGTEALLFISCTEDSEELLFHCHFPT